MLGDNWQPEPAQVQVYSPAVAGAVGVLPPRVTLDTTVPGLFPDAVYRAMLKLPGSPILSANFAVTLWRV